MRRGPCTALLASAALAVVGVGCGAEDFENNPRPPAPVELTARVDQQKVVVAPTEINGAPVGAGLVTVTISNQTPETVAVAFDGPGGEQTSDPIMGNGVGEIKINLDEGQYMVGTSDGTIRATELEVGPERETAQNDLLLP